MSSYQSGYIRCPFYRRDNATDRIYCESPLDTGGRYAILTFLSREELLSHQDDFCMSCYEGCPMFLMIRDTKYGEDHKNGYI